MRFWPLLDCFGMVVVSVGVAEEAGGESEGGRARDEISRAVGQLTFSIGLEDSIEVGMMAAQADQEG